MGDIKIDLTPQILPGDSIRLMDIGCMGEMRSEMSGGIHAEFAGEGENNHALFI